MQEPQTRFELAVECGNLGVAVETARELDKPALWTALGQAALSQGNIQIVELAYQKLKNFEKLSFLYLITGDGMKLARMGKIAEHRGDYGSEFQNSLWTGNVESRIRLFKELDLCKHPELTNLFMMALTFLRPPGICDGKNVRIGGGMRSYPRSNWIDRGRNYIAQHNVSRPRWATTDWPRPFELANSPLLTLPPRKSLDG